MKEKGSTYLIIINEETNITRLVELFDVALTCKSMGKEADIYIGDWLENIDIKDSTQLKERISLVSDFSIKIYCSFSSNIIFKDININKIDSYESLINKYNHALIF